MTIRVIDLVFSCLTYDQADGHTLGGSSETFADPASLWLATLLASSAEAAACLRASELQCMMLVLCGMITYNTNINVRCGEHHPTDEITGGGGGAWRTTGVEREGRDGMGLDGEKRGKDARGARRRQRAAAWLGGQGGDRVGGEGSLVPQHDAREGNYNTVCS